MKKKRKIKKIKKAKKRTSSPTLIHHTRIRVIGIGGGGSSIVSEIASQVKKVDFVVANTDVKALREAARNTRTFSFGQNLTGGLGCGTDVRLGQKAAHDEKNRIVKLFKNIDLCVLVASLGGGAGSGAVQEFAKIAKDLQVLTFGIFTLPFKFEGSRKMRIARNALEKITDNLNTLAIIPNENIFQIIDKKTPLKEAFSAINWRLARNLQGLIEMIYLPGLINIDFADLKTILAGKGKLAYLNSAVSQGQNRVEEALKALLKNPLNQYGISGAEKILFNITASRNLGMREVEEISQTIADFNKRAKIIFGISQNDNYKDKIRITILAVGCGKEKKLKPKSKKTRQKPSRRLGGSAKMPARSRYSVAGGRSFRRRNLPKIKISRRVKKVKKPVKSQHKRKIKKVKKPIRVQVPVKEEKEEMPPVKTLTRRSALDLKKAAEKTEQEMLEQEKKWDLPAFLRRKPQESK